MSARAWLPVVFAALLARPAAAHDGPPYPILVDEPILGAKLSVWADPDVGVGTFYLYFEDAEDGFSPPPIRVGVRPLDEQREERSFEAAVPGEKAPYGRIAEVEFDHRGPWRVRFLLDETPGQRELALDVDVTPPGLGAFNLIWFLSPFLAVGLLWAKVVLSKRSGSVDRPE